MATGTYTTLSTNPLNQDGHRTTTDGWQETTDFLTPGSPTGTSGWAGLIFDFNASRTVDAGTGLWIIPPIAQLTSLVLTEFASIGPVPFGSFALFYVDDMDPDRYSASLLPGNRGESTSGTRPTIIGSGSFGRPTTTITISSTAGVIPALGLTNAADTAIKNLFAMMQDANWSGRLALSLQNLGTTQAASFRSGNLTLNVPSLMTNESLFHTGHDVGGVMKRGRARHCARSGLPANTADLIPDGYLDGGYHVLGDWWEPEDRAGLDYIIPASEGEIDDANTGSS